MSFLLLNIAKKISQNKIKEMLWIILTWLTLQFILINITPELGIGVPPSIFYLFTFFIVIPLSILIAHLASSKTLINKKGKFTNFLFGTTVVLDIFFLTFIPSTLQELPIIVKTQSQKMLAKNIPAKEKKQFLQEIDKISSYTTNILFADPELVNKKQWIAISEYWNAFATAIKDGKIDDKEINQLGKIYSTAFGKEVTGATKNRSHRDSSGKRRNNRKNNSHSRSTPTQRSNSGK